MVSTTLYRLIRLQASWGEESFSEDVIKGMSEYTPLELHDHLREIDELLSPKFCLPPERENDLYMQAHSIMFVLLLHDYCPVAHRRLKTVQSRRERAPAWHQAFFQKWKRYRLDDITDLRSVSAKRFLPKAQAYGWDTVYAHILVCMGYKDPSGNSNYLTDVDKRTANYGRYVSKRKTRSKQIVLQLQFKRLFEENATIPAAENLLTWAPQSGYPGYRLPRSWNVIHSDIYSSLFYIRGDLAKPASSIRKEQWSIKGPPDWVGPALGLFTLYGTKALPIDQLPAVLEELKLIADSPKESHKQWIRFAIQSGGLSTQLHRSSYTDEAVYHPIISWVEEQRELLS
jgi:hypothetical protein